MITLNDYLTSSGSYPNRTKLANDEVIANAEKLLKAINDLLKELKIDKVVISSGFRPPEANVANGGAKKSNHMTGCALDILIDKKDIHNPLRTLDVSTLEKYGLYMENQDYTKGKFTDWCHLQITPTKSGRRIFIP